MNRDRIKNQFPILKLNDSNPSPIAIPPRKSTKEINFLEISLEHKEIQDEDDLNRFRSMPRKKKDTKEKRLSMAIEKPTFEEFVSNLKVKLGVPDDLESTLETNGINNDRDTLVSNEYVSSEEFSARDTIIDSEILFVPPSPKTLSPKKLEITLKII